MHKNSTKCFKIKLAVIWYESFETVNFERTSVTAHRLSEELQCKSQEGSTVAHDIISRVPKL